MSSTSPGLLRRGDGRHQRGVVGWEEDIKDHEGFDEYDIKGHGRFDVVDLETVIAERVDVKGQGHTVEFAEVDFHLGIDGIAWWSFAGEYKG
jgi:hypothetical protein